MGFYAFRFAELFQRSRRGRRQDILIMTFGVVVNNRDQGLYALTAPIFSGHAQSASNLRETAAINGYPGPKSTNSRKDFSIGPIEVADADTVIVAYAGNNISDDPDLVHREDFDQALTKAVSAFYVAAFGGAAGELLSTLGLAGAIEFLRGLAPDEVEQFLGNPVGYLLGLEPTGPCNGFVYKDALRMSGHELSRLSYEPVTVDRQVGAISKATLRKSYTDEELGHNIDNCGDLALTDVTIEITRFEKFSLNEENAGGFATWGPLRDGRPVVARRGRGIREISGLGTRSDSVKRLYGLRN